MKPDINSTLEKGLDMLFQFTEETPQLSVKEIIERLDLPRSTAYRLLETLKAKKLIEEHSPGRYRLGLSILQLAKVVGSGIDLIQLAHQVMYDLAKKFDETVILTTLFNNHAICLDHVESSKPLKLSFVRGKVLPLYLGASAKILFAFMDESQQERLLASLVHNGKVDDAEKLRKELQTIRNNGYVMTDQEVDPGAWAVAAPILGSGQKIIAGLSVAGPLFRIDDKLKKEITKSIIDAAQRLSESAQLMSIESI